MYPGWQRGSNPGLSFVSSSHCWHLFGDTQHNLASLQHPINSSVLLTNMMSVIAKDASAADADVFDSDGASADSSMGLIKSVCIPHFFSLHTITITLSNTIMQGTGNKFPFSKAGYQSPLLISQSCYKIISKHLLIGPLIGQH